MGLFRRRSTVEPPPPQEEERSLTIDAIAAMARNSSASYTYSGASVTLDSALKSAAAWACITRLKSTATGLPIDVIRSSGGRRTVLDKAAQPELVASPSGAVGRRAWIGQVVHSLATAGNAYGDVVRVDPYSGRPLQIETIDSSRVKFVQGVFTVDGKARERWPNGDLWHVAASHLMVPGSPVALSPVEYGRESIATGMAAEHYGGSFFRAGGMPVAVLSATAPGSTQEQVEMTKAATLKATENRGVLALGSGWKLEPFNVNPKDTQFLELLDATVLDACRRWLVPPSMIFAGITGQNITYSNLSDSDLAYLKHGVQTWLVDLEDSLSVMIPGALQAKFNVDAILRMDVKSRTDIHKVRLETKTRTINEVRRLEDEEPFDDPIYDEPGIPADGTDAPATDPADPTSPDMPMTGGPS